MAMRRLPLLALGAGLVVAACESDRTPDVTAPTRYDLDLRTSPAEATLATGSDSVRLFFDVINPTIADTALQRVAKLTGGPPQVRVRLQDQADTSVVRVRAQAGVTDRPGLYGVWIVRRAPGTAEIITEFDDVSSGRMLADTVTITVN